MAEVESNGKWRKCTTRMHLFSTSPKHLPQKSCASNTSSILMLLPSLPNNNSIKPQQQNTYFFLPLYFELYLMVEFSSNSHAWRISVILVDLHHALNTYISWLEFKFLKLRFFNTESKFSSSYQKSFLLKMASEFVPYIWAFLN